MANAPINVWNEVRFTSDGISISLFSESQEGGAIVEDELWLTYDEMKAMSPSEPQSLNLSDETVENLADQRKSANIGKIMQSDSLEEKGEHLPENPTADELLAYMGLDDMSEVEDVAKVSVGDVVRDCNPPPWSDNERMEVVGIPDKSADEYVVQESPDWRDDVTVANVNASYDADAQVVECVYQDDINSADGSYSDDDVYAFPRERLEPVDE